MNKYIGKMGLVLVAIILGTGFVAFAFQTVGLQYTTLSKNTFLTAIRASH